VVTALRIHLRVGVEVIVTIGPETGLITGHPTLAVASAPARSLQPAMSPAPTRMGPAWLATAVVQDCPAPFSLLFGWDAPNPIAASSITAD
jgi:hypothetical protein